MFIMTEDLPESTVYGSFNFSGTQCGAWGRAKIELSAPIGPINGTHLNPERVQFFRPCARSGPVRGARVRHGVDRHVRA